MVFRVRYPLASFTVCSVILCFVSSSWSADQSSRIRFSWLSEAEGFTAGRVTAFAEEQRGMIWLATDQGLNRFDGAGSTEFHHDADNAETLSSNRITSLVFGPAGKLWVGTANAGLNCFDPLALTARRLPLKNEAADNHFRSDEITSLSVMDEQFLLVGTRNGLDILHIPSGKIQTSTGIADGIHITGIFEDSNQALWAGAESGELFKWNPQSSNFQLFWKAGVPLSAIGSAPGGELWIGTMGRGLLRLNLETKQARPTSLDSRDITSIQTDSNGSLWIGTTEGLAHLSRGAFQYDLHRNDAFDGTSLSHNHVACVFESRAKVIWIGTAGGGASRFGLNRTWFPQYRTNPGNAPGKRLPHDSVWSMTPADGNQIWIGTESGLTLWDPEQESYSTPDFGPEIGTPYVSALLEAGDGTVWAGTKGDGLIRMPDGDADRAVQFRHRKQDPSSLSHDFITAILEDSQARLWFGTHGGGLMRLQGSSPTFVPIPVAAPADAESAQGSAQARFIIAMTEDESGRLMVTASDGLYSLAPGADQLVAYRHPGISEQQLAGKTFSSILRLADGTLFAGTAHDGLIEIKPDGETVRFFSHSNSDLPSDRILGLLADLHQRIWITTSEGIAMFDPATEHFRLFNDLDGLQSGTFHANACARTADGALFFGGGQGFHRIDPEQLPPPRQPPTPYLSGFERFGVPVVPQPGGILEKSIAATSEVRMPFDRRNHFGFHFANLGTEFPFRGQFRYQLNGFDESWQVANGNRKALYPAMRPGSYTFMVQSSPDGNKWNGNAAEVRLVITPPWWHTWWARSIFAAVFVAIAATAWWLQRQAQQRRMEQRERKLKSQRDKAEAQLAVQLQNAVLLERTSHSFSDSVQQDDAFKEPLENLATHYEVDRCLLCSLEVDAATGASHLIAIGEYRSDRNPTAPAFVIPCSDPFARQVLESDAPVQSDQFLCMRTTFQGAENGVLVIDGSGRQSRQRGQEDLNLLQSVAVQFGIAIAQRNLTLKEELYRRQLEQAREEADRANQAKTSFLSRMTHDLRTPLSAILGFTRLLQDDKTLDGQHRGTVDIISESGEHLLSVINDTLDVAKIEAGKLELNPESFELLPMLRSIQEVLRGKVESKGLDFSITEVSALPSTVETDRGKLRQILVNLLGNAIKFTDHGSISLKVAARPDSSGLEADAAAPGQLRLYFQVSDTGKGIAEKDFARLFQEFSQTDSGRGAAESTGLGLSIARSFAQLMGGDITVTSELGVGTAFEFSVLCREIAASPSVDAAPPTTAIADTAPAAALSEAQPAAAPDRSVANFRILIVDDKKLNRLLLSKVLGAAGYDLIEADDGHDAVEKWRETRPQLILMDENMPTMQGSEAARVILSECEPGQRPALISFTANAFEETRQQALDAGFDDFISKPFDHDDLLTKARHFANEFHGRSRADSSPAASPSVAPPAAAAVVASAAPSGSAANIRILVVDDEKLNRLLLSKVLGTAGYDLVEAGDGEDAIEKWRETRPQLILMDENMPTMQGSEAAQAILRACEPGHEPVMISFTANALEEARQQALNAGFHDVICKPFDHDDLLSKVSSYCSYCSDDGHSRCDPGRGSEAA